MPRYNLYFAFALLAGCGDSSAEKSVESPFDRFEKSTANEMPDVPDSQGALGTASYVQQGRPPIIPVGVFFNCTPVRVWDGDGPIWCAEGPRVRLAGISARELDDSCSEGHPCVAANGEDARDYLVNLVGKKTGVAPEGHILVEGNRLQCVSKGSAVGDRTGAWCQTSDNVDLSCAMITAGKAAKWDRYFESGRCSHP